MVFHRCTDFSKQIQIIKDQRSQDVLFLVTNIHFVKKSACLKALLYTRRFLEDKIQRKVLSTSDADRVPSIMKILELEKTGSTTQRYMFLEVKTVFKNFLG